MDVDYYSLERPVQDRFADATRSIGLPAPLAREAPEGKGAVLWSLGAVVCVLVLGGLVAAGMGDVDSGLALPKVHFAALYGALVAASLYCLLRGLGSRVAGRVLPYSPGLYLFPAGVCDARGAVLHVFRHPELQGIEVQGAALRVRVSSGEFTFRFADAEAAEQARATLDDAGRQYVEAARTDSRRELARLDPLIDSGFSSPFSPQVRLVKVEPFWARFALVVAVGTGAALGPAIWKGRNLVSERALFARAVASDDVSGYRAYLARGGNRPEVSAVRLPRAELRVAVQAGTVEALESYVRKHPRSQIQAEVDAALRAAVGAELDRARQAGTVSALRALATQRKTYEFVLPAIETATVVLYRKALEGFATNKSPEVASFFERLLGHTKARGPRVSARIVRRIPDSVAEADGQVKRSAYFMGKQSIPSQYFVGAYAEAREKALLGRLLPALSGPFPADMVELHSLPAHTEPGDPPPVAGPLLTIEYVPEMSGGYMSPKPRGVFVGVGMLFKATFAIPGDTLPLEFKFSLWRTPNPQILKNEGTTVADVYEKMAGDAFDKFGTGLLEHFLGSPKTEASAHQRSGSPSTPGAP